LLALWTLKAEEGARLRLKRIPFLQITREDGGKQGVAVNPTFSQGPGGGGRRQEIPTAPLRRRRKLTGRLTIVMLVALSILTGSLAGLTLVYCSNLPQITELEHYRPSTTTDLYDRKGQLIGSFALERRIVVDYSGFAPVLRSAVLSIEDKNFESHWGINVFRIAGAVWYDVRSHGRAQGASTLTMQLARNLFLSADRKMGRKLQEAFLAIQIERAFTKQQIFTLYGNQIYLGSGMYGFEAASQYYFSKHASELNLPEAALLAGLPKAPVGYSPITNPDKALKRRNLVISEMESDKIITHEQAEAGRAAPLGLHLSQPQISLAPWFQEEVRRELEKQFGSDEVHEAGLRVDTTLDLDLQKVANQAVPDGLAAYERRHGWKGRLENVLGDGITLDNYKHADWNFGIHAGDYSHALVVASSASEIRARIGTTAITLTPADWAWTGISDGSALAKVGDIIYLHLDSPTHATLEQDSGAQGALMALDNTTGDVLAMVGGRDYALSVFNRATQAERQTGSSFKPYVYTAAIEDGSKPSDIIVDSPVSYGGYSPHNYENDFKGAMTLEAAFAESRNVPAVKLAAKVGIHKVIDLVHRFGVTSNIPAYLPVALGAAEVSLAEQVSSYSVFPNDGLRVHPRFIRKVSNADGITLWEDRPAVDEVISQDTARTMMTLLRGVTSHGTGAAASQLNHPVGGKTGTTSDYTDAWFLGFSPSVTCGVWVGYDSRQSLGEKETGAKAALPIWMTLMKAAIVGKDSEHFGSDAPPAPKPDANSAAPNQPVANAAPKPPTTGAPPPPRPGQSPANTAARPVAPAVGKSAQPSGNPAVKPALPGAAKPATPMPKPALPTTKPTLPATKPATSTSATQAAKSNKPPTTTAKPTTPATKPQTPVLARPTSQAQG